MANKFFLSFWAICYPFSPLTTQKIKILKLKKPLTGIIILHICTLNDNHMMYGSWDMEHNKYIFSSFWTVLCPFTPYGPRKTKFWKNEKNTSRYYHFTNVYQKWQSYDVWFLRYKAQRTEFFVMLDCFLPFYPLTTRKIKILKNWKKCLEILSFYTCVPQMTIIWCMVPEILSATDRFFCRFGPFFAFLPP